MIHLENSGMCQKLKNTNKYKKKKQILTKLKSLSPMMLFPLMNRASQSSLIKKQLSSEQTTLMALSQPHQIVAIIR